MYLLWSDKFAVNNSFYLKQSKPKNRQKLINRGKKCRLIMLVLWPKNTILFCIFTAVQAVTFIYKEATKITSILNERLSITYCCIWLFYMLKNHFFKNILIINIKYFCSIRHPSKIHLRTVIIRSIVNDIKDLFLANFYVYRLLKTFLKLVSQLHCVVALGQLNNCVLLMIGIFMC